MNAVAVDAKVVVSGANADERPEDVDDDDVMVVVAGVTHRHLEVRHAHTRVDVVVDGIGRLSAIARSVIVAVTIISHGSVAAKTNVQQRSRRGRDAIFVLEKIGKKIVLAALKVDWKRVSRNMSVDLVELRQRLKVVLSGQAGQDSSVDLRNPKGNLDEFSIKVLRLCVDMCTCDWHSFARAIAALNGLLRTMVDVGPVDWRLGICVL